MAELIDIIIVIAASCAGNESAAKAEYAVVRQVSDTVC